MFHLFVNNKSTTHRRSKQYGVKFCWEFWTKTKNVKLVLVLNYSRECKSSTKEKHPNWIKEGQGSPLQEKFLISQNH